MNILHVCLAALYNDNYTYQENLLPLYHKKQGHDVFIIASLINYNKDAQLNLLNRESMYMTSENIKVYRISYKKPVKINAFLRRYNNINKILNEIKPDIIFIHGLQFLDATELIKYKKKNEAIKLYVDNHADFINSGRNWISRNILHKIVWRYYAKKLEPFVEKFWGVTPLRCDFLKKIYRINAKKVDMLIMGVDEDKINFINQKIVKSTIRSQLNILSNDFVIITGGKIDKRKNIHLLMDAVAQINRDNVKLIVFGTPTHDMNNEIEQYSNNKHIRYIGWVDSDKVYDYFLSSDLAVFPGTHSVLWEQSAGCGLPCVLKYWEGMNHIDIDGNCLFLKEDSVEELRKLILLIIDDNKIYDQLKDSAERVKKYFSYKQIAKKSILIE